MVDKLRNTALLLNGDLDARKVRLRPPFPVRLVLLASKPRGVANFSSIDAGEIPQKCCAECGMRNAE